MRLTQLAQVMPTTGRVISSGSACAGVVTVGVADVMRP